MKAKDFGHDEPYYASHHHPEGQLFVLSRGVATATVNGGDWMMTPGCPCWIPPHALHGVRSLTPVAGISVFVAESQCAGMDAVPVVVKSSPFLLALMRRIGNGSSGAETRHLLQVLQDELRTAHKDRLFLPMPKRQPLEEITEYLSKSPEDRRELAGWATQVGLSPRSLARYFKLETECSFGQWRSLARIMKSLRLLVEGKQVATVSTEVGYEDTSAFIEAFRNTVGSSPRQYALSLQAVELALQPK